MLDLRNSLTVLWDDNSSFIDMTNDMLDFGRDPVDFEFVSLEDKLYVGNEKPIDKFFAQMLTANTNANTLTLKYYNGTSFVSVSGFLDDSRGFTRSGFVSWTRPTTDNETLEVQTTINGSEQYWYEITTSADHSAGSKIQALNLVFSDDQDIKREIPELITKTGNFPSGETSHILQHVSSRDEIIQEINRWEVRKRKDNETFSNNITAWDLLDSAQVRLASTYLTISKIYFNLTDATDSTEKEKSQAYYLKYKQALDLFIVEIDINDNGQRDTSDVQSFGRTHYLER